MAKEAAHPQDQSMEEILQSIKRIIAEENQEDAEPKPGKKIANNNAPAQSAADDVLELTELADDEGAIPDMPDVAPPPPTPETHATPMPSIADSILEVVERTPEPAAHKDVLDDIDMLLSSEAAKASAKALKSLQAPGKPAAPSAPTQPGMPFRSGHTVEDLALEALRPMLKEWLDRNLPGIVERLVEREVKKLSSL